ncbi:Na+-transporting NADH:ubiquinone oxidoreductase subunit NqrC [Aequitasia blattaphilus]|uniref:Uncharacterized protein n=1 Tax=Aequitasia blattaphilus TaxID=2949332 RepID=A0ABT1E836_9FIRM|nr:hypothetical protein [Aequitasia blattaphilus]MCP1101984.1 hypothetical protein [Aequitasia blattaphilus]MCR8614624.1 hypothetical protein [Aequitasia blattaphilus]
MKLKRDVKIPRYYFLIVVGIISLLAAVIVGAQSVRTKKKEEQAKVQEKVQVEFEEKEEKETSYSIDYDEYVVLENRQEFADALLGNYAAFLDQEVNVFVQKNEIKATRAKCVDSYIPYDHPEETYIYIFLDDEEETILEAHIEPKSKEIEIARSALTKADIKEGVWKQESNAPAIRDVQEEDK